MEKLMRLIVGISTLALYGNFHFTSGMVDPLVEILQPQTENEQKVSQVHTDLLAVDSHHGIYSSPANIASPVNEEKALKKAATNETKMTSQKASQEPKSQTSVESQPSQEQQRLAETEQAAQVEAAQAEAAQAEAERQVAERQAEAAQQAAQAEAERQVAEQQVQAAQRAAQAEAEQQQAARQAEANQPNRVLINGNVIPLVDAQGASAAPEGNMAGIWNGTGEVTDNAPTHIIGHNPGAFTCTFDLTIGSQISVVDRNGNKRDYTVYNIMKVNDDTVGEDGLEHWDDILNQPGESISLQACIDDFWNLMVLAH